MNANPNILLWSRFVDPFALLANGTKLLPKPNGNLIKMVVASLPAVHEPAKMRNWLDKEATTLSGMDDKTATIWATTFPMVSASVSDEDALASLATNDYIVSLMPENVFRVEIEIRNITEWSPSVLGPEDF